MKLRMCFTALLIVAIIWFAGCQVQQKTFVPPKGYIYARAFGEGATKEEAVKKAKEEALAELARNILVEVRSDISRRVEIVRIVSSKAAGRLESVFKRGIDIKSEMELIEIKWKIAEIKKLEDCYIATVYAMVDEAFARLALGTYIAMKIGEALLSSHQIFTAGALFESYKEFLEAALLQLPPKLSSKLTKLVGKIKENWLAAKEKATVIENASVTNEAEALKLLELYDELTNMACDTPPALIEVLNNKTMQHIRKLSLSIRGPSEVIEGQLVTLTVKLIPKLEGKYTLRVHAENARFPPYLTLDNGVAKMEGYVENGARITVSIGGSSLSASWAISRVYPRNLAGCAKVLAQSISPLERKTIVLPHSWHAADIKLASTLERELSGDPKLVTIREATRKLEDDMSNLLDEGKTFNPEILSVGVDEEGAFVFNTNMRLKIKNFALPDVEIEHGLETMYVKAFITVGQIDMALKKLNSMKDIESQYLKAFALYKGGHLEKAKRLLESLEDKYPEMLILDAKILLDMGLYKEAVKKARSYLNKVDKNSVKAFTIMAMAYSNIDDLGFLIMAYNDLYPVISSKKDFDIGFYVISVLLERLRNPEEAKIWIEKALNLKPNHPRYILEYARILAKLGKSSKAKELLENLIERDVPATLKWEVKEAIRKLSEEGD